MKSRLSDRCDNKNDAVVVYSGNAQRAAAQPARQREDACASLAASAGHPSQESQVSLLQRRCRDLACPSAIRSGQDQATSVSPCGRRRSPARVIPPEEPCGNDCGIRARARDEAASRARTSSIRRRPSLDEGRHHPTQNPLAAVEPGAMERAPAQGLDSLAPSR